MWPGDACGMVTAALTRGRAIERLRHAITSEVQIAKSFDTHLTAVCSARNTDMVMGIGANAVIDYAQHEWDGTGQYDLILDMVGDRPFETYVRNLTPEGRMVSVGALGMDTMAFMEKMAAYKASSQENRVVSYIAQVTTDDFVTLGQLLASEEVTLVIDRTFPLELAAQAMALQGSKRIRGKVVLVVKGDARRVSECCDY